jgi:hypothetical protein
LIHHGGEHPLVINRKGAEQQRPQGIPSFHHSIIPSFHHSIIPSFHHSIIPSFHHSIIPSLRHSVTPLSANFAPPPLCGEE